MNISKIKYLFFTILLFALYFFALPLSADAVSCTDGVKNGTCRDHERCSELITDKNSDCDNQVCCANTVQPITSNECTDGSRTGSCADITECKEVITDKNGVCQNRACCAEKFSNATPDNSSKTPAQPSSLPTLQGIQVPSGTGLPDPGSNNPVLIVITTILKWLLTIFLILAFIAFIVTGIQFLVAMGSSYSSAATNAKNNFQYAIIALVIVGASYIIVLTIDMLLRGGSNG